MTDSTWSPAWRTTTSSRSRGWDSKRDARSRVSQRNSSTSSLGLKNPPPAAMIQYATVFGRPLRSTYSVWPMKRRRSQVIPVSSHTSRSAAVSRVSPGSSFPLGNDQSCCTGRCTTTISRSPLCRRATRPPAAWTTSVWEGSSAVIARRATGSQVTVAPPPDRGNRAPRKRRRTRSSVTPMSDPEGEAPGGHDPVEIEWQFDALVLRPVERWLATLPTLAIETVDGGTVTALARPPRRLVDSYLDCEDWRIARAGFVVRTRRRGRSDEVTPRTTALRSRAACASAWRS